MPRYLSFDPAYRTLGWCDIEINIDNIRSALVLINTALDACDLHTARELGLTAASLLRSTITIHGCGVLDVLGTTLANTLVWQRANKLSACLAQLPPATTVLIEHQPPKLSRWGNASAQDSTCVANQIMFYYAAQGIPAYFVSPKCKNTIVLGGHMAQPAGPEHVRKTQRKQHAVINYKWICSNMTACNVSLQSSLVNHVADACLQAIAYNRNNI